MSPAFQPPLGYVMFRRQPDLFFLRLTTRLDARELRCISCNRLSRRLKFSSQASRYCSSQALASASGLPSSRRGRRCASCPTVISPARSRIFRCFEIAGWLIANGSASSVTDASPGARRARRARRGGSASARNVASRRSDTWVFIADRFNNYMVIYIPTIVKQQRDPSSVRRTVQSPDWDGLRELISADAGLLVADREPAASRMAAKSTRVFVQIELVAVQVVQGHARAVRHRLRFAVKGHAPDLHRLVVATTVRSRQCEHRRAGSLPTHEI